MLLQDVYNDTSVPFTFGSANDIAFPPNLPKNSSTLFTLSIFPSDDGNFTFLAVVSGARVSRAAGNVQHSICLRPQHEWLVLILADNLVNSESVQLVFIKHNLTTPVITLSDLNWTAAANEGASGSRLAAYITCCFACIKCQSSEVPQLALSGFCNA
jgi:hypothetical protein